MFLQYPKVQRLETDYFSLCINKQDVFICTVTLPSFVKLVHPAAAHICKYIKSALDKHIKSALDKHIKSTLAKNILFPLLYIIKYAVDNIPNPPFAIHIISSLLYISNQPWTYHIIFPFAKHIISTFGKHIKHAFGKFFKPAFVF